MLASLSPARGSQQGLFTKTADDGCLPQKLRGALPLGMHWAE